MKLSNLESRYAPALVLAKADRTQPPAEVVGVAVELARHEALVAEEDDGEPELIEDGDDRRHIVASSSAPTERIFWTY